MATTRRMAITTKPNAVIAYVCDKDKAELVTGLNCTVEFAADEFMALQHPSGKNKRYAYHTIQSFSPDDPVTPEMAHEIGVKLAKEIYGDYQCIVATHTDKGHIHNHIISSAVNMRTFQHMRDGLFNSTSVNHIRKVSDRLCREYGLSVLEEHKIGRYPHMHVSTLIRHPYRVLRDKFRKAFKTAIKSENEDQFWKKIKGSGFAVRKRKEPEITDKSLFKRIRYFPISQLVPYALERLNNIFHGGFRKKKSDEKRIDEILDYIHSDYEPNMFFYFESARLASAACKESDNEFRDSLYEAMKTINDEQISYPEDIDDKKQRISQRISKLKEKLATEKKEADRMEELSKSAAAYIKYSRVPPSPNSKKQMEYSSASMTLLANGLLSESDIKKTRNIYHSKARKCNRLQNRIDLLEDRLNSAEKLEHIKIPDYSFIRFYTGDKEPESLCYHGYHFNVSDAKKAGDMYVISINPKEKYRIRDPMGKTREMTGEEIRRKVLIKKEQEKNLWQEHDQQKE